MVKQRREDKLELERFLVVFCCCICLCVVLIFVVCTSFCYRMGFCDFLLYKLLFSILCVFVELYFIVIFSNVFCC